MFCCVTCTNVDVRCSYTNSQCFMLMSGNLIVSALYFPDFQRRLLKTILPTRVRSSA